jgi:hypothetical protein
MKGPREIMIPGAGFFENAFPSRYRFGLLLPLENRTFTFLQECLGIDHPEDPDQLGDQSRPTGLVAGAETRAVVAMEIFVEKDVWNFSVPP